jgi:RNA polymerase-interacting CarD/CdnL/TRCF family regulator
MTYNLNESVYIPGHGIGVLKEIKTIAISGQTQSLMAFEVVQTGIKIMIPQGSQAMLKLRAPIKETDAKQVLELLNSPAPRVENKPNYKKWNRMFQETIQQGNTKDLAALVSKIDGQRVDGPLATNEQRLLDTAKLILKSELEFALGKDVVSSQVEMFAA